jgi:hypothetical protein
MGLCRLEHGARCRVASTRSDTILTILIRIVYWIYCFLWVVNRFVLPFVLRLNMSESVRPVFQLVTVDKDEENGLDSLKRIWHGVAQCTAHFPAELVGVRGSRSDTSE